MRSTPSPSPPSGAQGHSNSRSRTKSGTQHLTMQQLNKKRQRATPEQLQVLEEYFSLNASPNAKMREIIADRIQMTERSVQIWFQNRYLLSFLQLFLCIGWTDFWIDVQRLSRFNGGKWMERRCLYSILGWVDLLEWWNQMCWCDRIVLDMVDIAICLLRWRPT